MVTCDLQGKKCAAVPELCECVCKKSLEILSGGIINTQIIHVWFVSNDYSFDRSKFQIDANTIIFIYKNT